MSDDRALFFYTIYEKPSDYPEYFVLRRWRVRGGARDVEPEGQCGLFWSLKEARDALPEGLYCLGRFEDEDPVIVETWV